MILTLDIGNTNIKTALFDGKEMRYYWRMSTNIQKSSDEYGIVLVNLFQHVGVRPEEVASRRGRCTRQGTRRPLRPRRTSLPYRNR